MSKFIRVLRESENMEVLLNVDCIIKIEVLYGVRSADPEDTRLHGVTLREGLTNPEAIRSYKVYVGSDSFFLVAGNDPVIRVIQDIYENAIRAPEPHESRENDI